MTGPADGLRTRERFGWLFAPRPRPLSIAHRGASHHAFDNAPDAFEKAAAACADLWEVDVRTAADGVAIAHHDPHLRTADGTRATAADTDSATLRRLGEAAGRPVIRFDEVVDLARRRGAGLYVDAKDERAMGLARDALAARAAPPSKAVIASFDAGALARLRADGCDWPIAVFVAPGADPFERASRARADVVHLCWRGLGGRAREVVTDELLAEAARRDLAVTLWHEERPVVLEAIAGLPVLGLFSNRPEMLGPGAALARAGTGPALACRGGFARLAPAGTLAGIDAAFGAGFALVSLDVRTTRDGVPVVVAPGVAVAPDGGGRIEATTLSALRRRDASGGDPWFAGIRVPTLAEALDLARVRGSRLRLRRGVALDPDGFDAARDGVLGTDDPTAVLEALRVAEGAR